MHLEDAERRLQQQLEELEPVHQHSEDFLTVAERNWLRDNFNSLEEAKMHGIVVTPRIEVASIQVMGSTHDERMIRLRDMVKKRHKSYNIEHKCLLLHVAQIEMDYGNNDFPTLRQVPLEPNFRRFCVTAFARYYAFKPQPDAIYEGIVSNLSNTCIGVKMRNHLGLYVNIERDCQKHPLEDKQCCRVVDKQLVQFKFKQFGLHPFAIFIYGTLA